MNSIANAINDENLIALSFDSSPISTVLNQILDLFKEQQRKMNVIEEALKDKVDISSFEKVYNELGSLNQECSIEFSDIRKKFTDFKRENDNQVKDMREQQEIDKLEVLAETRRLITSEIKQVSYDEEIEKLEAKIKSNEEILSRINADFDNMAAISTSAGPSTNNNASTAMIVKLERQLKDLESRIETYPTLEKNVNELMINFPLITKKLERKVNDLLEKEKNKDLGEMPNRSFSSNQNQLSSFRPSNANYQNLFNDLQDLPPMKPAPDFSAQQQEDTPKEIVTQRDIQEVREEEEEEDIKSAKEGEDNEDNEAPRRRPSISSIPKSKRRSLENMTNGKYNRDSKEDTKVIKVIENKTYKTEMNSSLRVVSELEWLNNLIQQHHEAIRSLQQKTRTQQENFDAVVESLTRVNSTNNTRISQISQQVNNVKNDNEALQKKTGEQLSKMFNIISELNSQIETIQKDVKCSKQASETDELESSKTAKTTSSKDDRLQRLKDKFNINFKDFEEDQINESNENEDNENLNEEEEGENEDIADQQNIDDSKSSEQAKNKNKLDSINLDSLNSTKPKGNLKFELCFKLCHFSINSIYNNFMVSEIRTINERSRTRIKPVELFSSNSYFDHPIRQPTQSLPEKQIPLEAEKSSEFASSFSTQSNMVLNSTQTVPSADFISAAISNNTNTNQIQNEPVNSRFDQFNLNSTDFLALGKAPKREIHEITVEDVPTEIIEEKVSVYARRVVAILVDSAKKDFKEEQQNLQKTVDQFVSQIDNKIDREFVERMFNKFRNAMNEMNEKIDNLQCSFLEWVTRDELEMVLNNFVKIISDVKDTAASKSKYNCLLCGRPRQHLAGMMVTGLKSSNASLDSSNNNTKSIERRSVDSNIITKPIVPVSKVIQ